MSALENPTPDAATVRAIAEALADVLVERGLVVQRIAGPVGRVLDVGQVADLLGRKPAWVYAHATELGRFASATGPRRASGSTAPASSGGSAIASFEWWSPTRGHVQDGRARTAGLGGRD